jgi:S1-C subfamily serine protease
LDAHGRVIGVAFETLDGAENIGYIIPVQVIQHFLEDIRRTGRSLSSYATARFAKFRNTGDKSGADPCVSRAAGTKGSAPGVFTGRCARTKVAFREAREHKQSPLAEEPP